MKRNLDQPPSNYDPSEKKTGKSRLNPPQPVEKGQRRASNFFLLLGTLFMFAALGLVGYNYHLDRVAAIHSQSVVTELQRLIIPSSPTQEVPLTSSAPELPQNEGILILGDLYLGILEIPRLGVNLPVHLDWSDAKLSTAPCAYLGNLSQGDLVIAGHNYTSHFAGLRTLNPGDTMKITDTNGQIYRYQVDFVTVMHQSQVEELSQRDQWDLTLYTCDTPDRSQRIVVRCVRV